MLLRVHGEHLTAAPFRQFLFDLFDQPAFFGIQVVFRKVARVGNDESDIPF